MKKSFCLIVCVLIFVVCAFVECAPPDDTPGSEDGAGFDVDTTVTDDYKLYMPDKEIVDVGFIFYLGTMMDLSNYDYVLTEIAASGVAVCVPNNAFADLAYSENEIAYEVLGAQRYFVGGHSQGGGAAVRRACENLQTTVGCILFSPLVSNDCSLAQTTLPAIFFQAENDRVLTDAMQQDAKSRMNDLCQYVLLEGAGHMCYGESDLLDSGGTVRDKREIQDEIASQTIAFIDRVIAGL